MEDNQLESKEGFRKAPDPHGHAALLLVESLIYVLKERAILGPSEAVDVVTTAIEVQADLTAAAGGPAAAKLWQSYALLTEIAESLKQDIRGSNGAAAPL